MKKEKNMDIICLQCQHLDRVRIGGCKAFPGEIPDLILLGQNDHSTPLKGQEGEYVFTPIDQQVKMWKRIDRSTREWKKNKKHLEVN